MDAENRRVVRRAFKAHGIDRILGEVVDVSGWRWAESLEKQDMLVSMPLSEDHITCGCGRHWRDVTAMERHACTDTEAEVVEVQSGTDEVVQLVARGRGWFDVTVRGEVVNKHALRLGAAETFMANIELEPAGG